jgi:ElaB/YqjD/DUF883 family membrane-anchored ribosome-binding protein
MANQSVKHVDNFLGRTSPGSVASAVNAAKDVLSSVETAIDSTTTAIKSEVNEISKAGEKMIDRTRSEVAKRPILYTLAAAGTGLLLGAAIMSIYGHPRK